MVSKEVSALEEIWASIGLEVRRQAQNTLVPHTRCCACMCCIAAQHPRTQALDSRERRGEVLAHIKKVLNTMLTQEKEQKISLEESIRTDRRTLQDLSTELDVAYNPV